MVPGVLPVATGARRPAPRGFRAPLARLLPVLLAVAVVAGCSSAKPQLPNSPQAKHNMRVQGAAMIDSLVRAHGGMAAWERVKEISFRGTDEWQGPWDRLLNPWPVERVSGENRYRVHEDRGRVALVTDRGTLTYGQGASGPWALLNGQPSPEPKDERTASYIVSWNNFMVGLPWRFKESGAVAHYLGRVHRKYQNNAYEFDEVLVTYPPEGDVWPDDWFIVRMDPNTHEMRTVTYVTTHRNKPIFETTCEFSNFVTIDSLKIPTRRVCYLSSPTEAPLHTWTLADVRFDQVSADELFEKRTAVPTPVAVDSAAAATAAAARADSGAKAVAPAPAPATTAAPAPTPAAAPATAPNAKAAPAPGKK